MKAGRLPEEGNVAVSGVRRAIVEAGTRGRLARMRHGRVSRYCLAHARSPVLAVPPSALPGRAVRRLRTWPFRRRTLTVEQARHEWEGQKLNR